MWLSTQGGKDYLKCHSGAHTESQESSWLPGSQALSLLPLKVPHQNTESGFSGPRKFLATFKVSRQNMPLKTTDKNIKVFVTNDHCHPSHQ